MRDVLIGTSVHALQTGAPPSVTSTIEIGIPQCWELSRGPGPGPHPPSSRGGRLDGETPFPASSAHPLEGCESPWFVCLVTAVPTQSRSPMPNALKS